MNFILRLFLTLSAVSFFVVIFLVKNKIDPWCVHFENQDLLEYEWMIYVLYCFAPFVLTWFSGLICKKLSVSSLNKVVSVEASNNDFLSNYLAFFFVALSISDMLTFWIVLGMTVVFTFYSRVSYFNPVFLVFGFNFYYVFTNENTKVMLITRQKLKDPTVYKQSNVRRINDYTFIEI